jgi:catechol-2,3-dioxygenase
MSARLFTKIDTVAIRVRDLDHARAWYHEKLGVRELFSDKKENLVVISVGADTSLTLWQLKPGEEQAPKGAAGSFPILMAPDAKQIHRALSERGVETGLIQSSGSTLWFSFFDPDGNRIDVCEVFG